MLINRHHFLVASFGTFALALAALTGAAHADGSKAPPPAAYLQECGSCHAPFPAKMLPSASWRAVMTSLDKHYGTDASIDAPAAQALTQWLTASPSNKVSVRPPQDRVTKSTYFLRKHSEVSAAVWARPSIKSAVNCTACHTRAAEGSYSEREIVIPK
jgi:hypothetical protein